MLGAIEQKIKDIQYVNCQKNNTGSDTYATCPSNGGVSNIYLPAPEELYRETIYLNGENLKIGDIKDEILYQVEFREIKSSTDSIDVKNIQKINIGVPHNYILQYKKNLYSLEEAKIFLNKKIAVNEKFLVTSIDQK